VFFDQVTLGTIGGAMLSLAPGPGDAVAHAGPTAETVGRVMVGNAVLFCLYALGTFYWRSHKIKSGHAGAFDDRIGPAVLCVMLLGGFAATLLVHTNQLPAVAPARVCASLEEAPRCCESELLIMRHGEKLLDSSPDLSADGQNRAQYLARCLQPRSAARSMAGGVKSLIATLVRPGKSERSGQTLQPLADALRQQMDQSVDKADYRGFVALIQRAGTVRHPPSVLPPPPLLRSRLSSWVT
jgi:hypothetical protein